MNLSGLIEIFRQVADSLKANKLRAFLSALGVVIGISVVILMGWALAGLDLALDKTFNMMGTDMLYVDKYDWAGGKKWSEIRQRKNISMRQAEELIERLTLAELAIPIARHWNVSVKNESKNYEGMIAMGTKAEYGLTPAGAIEYGRFFSAFEDRNSENVVVLGHKVNKTLFPDGDGLEKTLKINGHKFKVVGVVEKRGVLFIDFIDNQIFMPIKTFLGLYGGFNRSMSVAVKAGKEEYIDEVRTETIGAMRVVRNIPPGEEDDFSINETKAFEDTVAGLRIAVYGIGIGMTALSFIVGIIGIMNIMFVSVTERTKEIGIRKAIGATKLSIWFQIIFESMILCFMGALISFVGCSILTFAFASLIPSAVPELDFLPKILPLPLFFVAAVVSFAVGILSGLMPAIRAANMDPVDALRYE